jgi:hypothetical protein
MAFSTVQDPTLQCMSDITRPHSALQLFQGITMHDSYYMASLCMANTTRPHYAWKVIAMLNMQGLTIICTRYYFALELRPNYAS